MITDAAEDVRQVGLRIKAVHLGGLNDGHGTRQGFGTGACTREEPIFASYCHRPFILPMSAKSGRSIIVGTPILAGASVFEG